VSHTVLSEWYVAENSGKEDHEYFLRMYEEGH
jgi:hypothetical protein